MQQTTLGLVCVVVVVVGSDFGSDIFFLLLFHVWCVCVCEFIGSVVKMME